MPPNPAWRRGLQLLRPAGRVAELSSFDEEEVCLIESRTRADDMQADLRSRSRRWCLLRVGYQR